MIPPWHQLRAIGNSKILRSSYLWFLIVPIAAKFLGTLNDKATIKVFEHTFTFHLALPFSWKIFYFSSVCFGIATLSFAFRCPMLIRDFDNFTEFRESGRGDASLNNWVRALLRYHKGDARDLMLQGLNTKFVDWIELVGASPNGGQETVIFRDHNDEQMKELFWYIRGLTSYLHPVSRFGAALFFFLGFTLFSIIIAQNMWYVLTS